MMFKIGDRVTILLSNIPIYVKRNIGKATSGIIIEDCPGTDCMVVRLNTGKVLHLFTYRLALVIKKNVQLEFNFMSAMDSE